MQSQERRNTFAKQREAPSMRDDAAKYSRPRAQVEKKPAKGLPYDALCARVN